MMTRKLTLLVGALACLATVGCQSQPKDVGSEVWEKLGPEGRLEFMVLSEAADRKPASDPGVTSLMELCLMQLRKTDSAADRIGGARGLGQAAFIGLIGMSSNVAAEALYKASIADPDPKARAAAAEALEKVKSYRRGEVEGRAESPFNFSTGLEPGTADASNRLTNLQVLARSAARGTLGVSAANRTPEVLERLAATEKDEVLRAAAIDALKKVRDYRATLDPAVLEMQR